ncbi:MAG: thioredoxin domain-containing protein [Bryobacteraceae bacterium]|nr:thioredoxin domain-containing protein [Bryobacteraceae bacterium]
MHTNRLAHEKSPYLQQHAHNPVDWYAWGEEAFEKARREDKPIFLSIGYSTCHWCHVMERESFESESTAELLNRSFVSIKVDREERPDVDRIYMMFVQATSGGGGWPMSVWLTPDLKPFYGGTYYPPRDAYGRPGFPTVLHSIAEAWSTDRARIAQSSDQILQQLRQHLDAGQDRGGWLDESVLESGFNVFRRGFDTRLGGFGGAPKFPRPVVHNFLLRYHAGAGNEEARDMVLATLRHMAAGGMNDQIGGGFHRYSVDERWFLPHFEKMLYDQAQLAVSYLEARQITGDDQYAAVAREIFEYVLRDMTSPEGAFYSAEDADSVIDPEAPSVKGEGAFYVWTREEIDRLLGSHSADWFCYRYGVEAGGNVLQDPHQEFAGKNILYQAHSIEETAERFDADPGAVRQALEEARPKLLDYRARRVRPHLDDKLLTAWNGMMISAFALGFQALGDERYLEAARKAAGFILGEMYDSETGILKRRHRAGDTAIPGFLDDYASFTGALVDLYESCFEAAYLERAVRLAEKAVELFEDKLAGGFFSSAEGDASLVLRMKEDYDGAEPSGNSVMTLALLRLAAITGRNDFREAADRALAAAAPRLRSAPVAAPQMLVAYAFARSKPRQIVLAGEYDEPGTRNFLQSAWRRFLPHRVLILVDEASRETLARYVPAIVSMTKLDGKPAAYVCQDFACRLPTANLEQFNELLN